MSKFFILTSVFLATTIVSQAAVTPDATKLLYSAALRFEPSKDSATYVTRGLRFHASISASCLRINAPGRSMLLRFAGSSADARLSAGESMAAKSNLLLGNDRSRWRTAVPNYKDLLVTGLYPGINVRYYGSGDQLEYDWIVAPRANPSQVRLQFDGAQPSIDRDGNLSGSFLQRRPEAFQMKSGKRVSVDSRYVRNADGTFGVRLAKYDSSLEVVIDPVLTFSTYVAGTGQDIAYGIGHDSSGFLYVAGTTAATDLDLAGDSNTTSNTGSFDIFVAKLDPAPGAATPIVYATYLGGTGADNLKAMAVSPAGLVYLAGVTASSDFPMAGNSVQTALSGTTDAFVAVVDPSQPSGSALVYSSYYGGTKDDTAYGIAYDSNGLIYVTGDTDSTDLPTNNPYQSSLSGTEDAFVVVFNPSNTSTNFATYLGGSSTEYARGIAVASDGTVWISGGTYSSDFPLSGNPYNVNYDANCDVFLARLDPVGGGASALLYSTFLGGNGQDIAETLSIDPKGRLLISGLTSSTDFPVTKTAIQTSYGGGMDAFVAILDTSLTAGSQLAYSTYYGGRSVEIATSLKLDALGVLHVAGYTASSNLPVTANALFPTYSGGYDGFYLKLNPQVAGTPGFDYATYVSSPGTQVVYGVDVDASSNVYLAGYTSTAVFDAIGGASKGTAAGDVDAFVMGFSPCGYALSAASNQFPVGGGTFTLALTGGTDCTWSVANPLSWVTVTPGSGSGSATLVVNVAANTTGTARTGSITVAGLPFLIGQ